VGFFGAAFVNAVVEIADAKKNIPASATVLSMGFSCGEVVCDDAGPPTARVPRRCCQGVQQQPHQGKILSFRRSVSGKLF
jgi:hypothetical protein